jgi:hypothetical protein
MCSGFSSLERHQPDATRRPVWAVHLGFDKATYRSLEPPRDPGRSLFRLLHARRSDTWLDLNLKCSRRPPWGELRA